MFVSLLIRVYNHAFDVSSNLTMILTHPVFLDKVHVACVICQFKARNQILFSVSCAQIFWVFINPLQQTHQPQEIEVQDKSLPHRRSGRLSSRISCIYQLHYYFFFEFSVFITSPTGNNVLISVQWMELSAPRELYWRTEAECLSDVSELENHGADNLFPIARLHTSSSLVKNEKLGMSCFCGP